MKIPENKQFILFGGIFVLANKLQAVADKTVQGLSTKQWFLLRSLSDMPMEQPPTITLLAKTTDTSRQNTSKMLEVLQRQGYVDLQYNELDHRSQSVVLTDKGTQILRQMAQNSVPFFTELFSNLTTQECEVAAEVVVKLIKKLNQTQEDMK